MVGKQRYSVSSSVKIGFSPSAGAMHRISLLGSMAFSVTRVLALGALGSSSLVLSCSLSSFSELSQFISCRSCSFSALLLMFEN